MTAYYAVANVNGPINRRIDAEFTADAQRILRDANRQAWIDEPATDAEDYLGIRCDDYDAARFDAVLIEHGFVPVACDVPEWMLWRVR